MENQADKEKIVINVILNIGSALQEGKRFEAEMQKWKTKILELKELGLTTSSAFHGLLSNLKNTFIGEREELIFQMKALRAAQQEVKKLDAQADRLKVTWRTLLKTFQGTLSALVIFRLINGVIEAFESMREEARKFIDTLAELQTSTNALRREGIDVSFSKNIALIKQLRKEYKAFSDFEIAQLIAQLQLMTRNFGFSAQELEQLIRTSLDIAIIKGKEVGEVIQAVVQFIATGRAETLQGLGVSVNKVAVAQEALALGYNKGYGALTEYERAQAALNVILDQSADIHEIAIDRLETEAGAIQQIDGEIRNLKQLTGALSTESEMFAKKWEQAWARAGASWSVNMEVVQTNFKRLGLSIKIFYYDTIQIFSKFTDEQQKELDKLKTQLDDLNDYYQTIVEIRRKMYAGEWEGLDVTGILEKKIKTAPLTPSVAPPPEATEEAEQELENIEKAWENFFKNIINAEKKFTEDMLEAQSDLTSDLEKIDKKYMEKSLEAWSDYQEKLKDINEELAWDIEEARRELADDLEDLEIDTQRQLEDAARKYHEQELKAERDFQEKMRKLREEFLFDLEDALRERDALQVLRLIRRYQLDKEQAQREYELEREERLRAYQQEIEDIRRQAERKREELYREFQRKLEDLQRQAEREREQARLDYEKKLAELKEQQEEERQERIKQYQQTVEDIKQNLLDALASAAQSFFDSTGQATEAYVNTMAKLIGNVFGKNGIIDAQFKNFNNSLRNTLNQALSMYQQIQQLVAQSQALLNSLGSSVTTVNGSTIVNPNANPYFAGGYQAGGTVLATKPTMALFGEAGPEIASFIPLSKLNQKGAGGGSGYARVEVWLSPGLEGKIIDSTLDQTANVFLRVLEER